MKNYLILALLLVNGAKNINAQSPYGEWYARIKTFQLDLVFHIKKEGKQTLLTWDSPNQKAFNVPGEIKLKKKNAIEVAVKNIGMTYTGTYFKDSLVGTFQQGNFTEKLVFYTTPKSSKPKRPQEPKAPFLYEEEEIKFFNSKDSVRLTGTFTRPQNAGRFPAVILVSGSGPQDRNEEILGHKPFLVIADYLTKAGYAVLRYDDRGTYSSEGTFKGATTFDFANDAEAAFEYLSKHENVLRDQIVIIGHSEGGTIANILGARIPNLLGIVSLAGTSIRGDSILEIQNALINRSNGMSEEHITLFQEFNRELYRAVMESSTPNELSASIKPIVASWKKRLYKNKLITKKEKKMLASSILDRLEDPWLYSFIRYSPSEHIRKIGCNILVLIGEKDIQVTSKENLENYKRLLPSNGKMHSFLEMKGLNHFFQTCSACSLKEYGELEETFSKEALKEIQNFLDTLTK